MTAASTTPRCCAPSSASRAPRSDTPALPGPPELPGRGGADTCPVAPRRRRARNPAHRYPYKPIQNFNKLLTYLVAAAVLTLRHAEANFRCSLVRKVTMSKPTPTARQLTTGGGRTRRRQPEQRPPGRRPGPPPGRSPAGEARALQPRAYPGARRARPWLRRARSLRGDRRRHRRTPMRTSCRGRQATEVFARFSTVAGSPRRRGRHRADPRGFALKFYTEEGNYDLVGNNTPIFFIKDPLKFPDFIHSQKPDPTRASRSPTTSGTSPRAPPRPLTRSPGSG